MAEKSGFAALASAVRYPGALSVSQMPVVSRTETDPQRATEKPSK
jgi:hypothetical protein